MQAILDFVNNHFYDIFLPLIILGFLRVAMCLAQLKRTATIRRKKGVYHSVRGNYTELGAWIGILLGLWLCILLPRLWYLGLVLAVALGVLGGKLGTRKGAELDSIYREVALELKREAEAEAARETASRTLESGAEKLPEPCEIDDTNETTENKGEIENG